MNDVVYSINGPVVKVKNARDFFMLEMVYVGKSKLVGEVISVTDEYTTIQVYETTTGLKPGEPVFGTNSPLSATLGPGIISGIFDGIERPLLKLEELTGYFIDKGSNIPSLNSNQKWDTTILAKKGERVFGGQIFATCAETPVVEHRSMIPPNLSGEIVYAAPSGSYSVDDVLLQIKDSAGNLTDIGLSQKWPIRTARPVRGRISISKPLFTGQRVIDSLFPIAKGGTAAIPGGFGTGKTMTQHQLAKWCDADIIVYIGCGERGNEMTQVLREFAELIDPKTNRPLTDRTILIANTSNMPVAAREASIYTGITLAEYYRDMGYHVAIMADSTSRWAEALREISGRLEEMPAEEGFPAYLPSRIAEFYERAGEVTTLSEKEGSITIIGAVSPQGADFSEPVTQNTKRFVRCFWALDKSLAYRRHYPAINWNISYSDYIDDMERWYYSHVGKNFLPYRQRILSILHDEDVLMETVKLIGSDVLPDDQRLIIETAKVIRVGFLQQNAFHSVDTYVPLDKQYRMMEVIIGFYDSCKKALDRGVQLSEILETTVAEDLIKMKYEVGNDSVDKFDDYLKKIAQQIESLPGENT